jgi:hypothetical protein
MRADEADVDVSEDGQPAPGSIPSYPAGEAGAPT